MMYRKRADRDALAGLRSILSTFGCMLSVLAILMSCTETTYTGRISVRGNEPHTYLALVTSDNQEYRIVGDLEQKIRSSYQNKRVTVAGRIVKEALGPGFPTELRVEKVLKVEDRRPES